MTTYSKPTVRNAWGQGASASDLQDPGNTYANAGWQIGVKPPRQYFNWVLNYVMAGIRYSCQRGIPDWDASETYSSGSYVQSAAGYIWRGLAGSIGVNPDTATIGVQWDIPYVQTAAAGDNTPRIANTHWVSSYYLPVGSTFLAIVGQITTSQVPASVVTQWQGSLSISGGQITSAVSRANNLLLTGSGNYASFNYAGQSGQPTWLWGTNDGANVAVWNPSNFSVANANTLAGLGVTAAAAGNTVMARDGNGYAYTVYLNQASSNNENPSISQFMVTNGVDGFLRKSSVAAAKAAIGALGTSDFPALLSANGYQKLPSGFIIQWGSVTAAGTGPTLVSIVFPISFPHACFSATCSTGTRSTGGAQGANFVSFLNQSIATFVLDSVASPAGQVGGYWIAIGW